MNEGADKTVTIAAMPVGSVGRRVSDGMHYLRTNDSAACLERPGSSYSGNADLRNKRGVDDVVLLPVGTRLTFEVTDYASDTDE